MIVDFKARFLFDASIRTTKVRQEIKPGVIADFKSGTNFNNMPGGHNCSDFAVRLDNFSYPGRVFTL